MAKWEEYIKPTDNQPSQVKAIKTSGFNWNTNEWWLIRLKFYLGTLLMFDVDFSETNACFYSDVWLDRIH